eukprot:5081858-Pyramimonas_sp.AAC.1
MNISPYMSGRLWPIGRANCGKYGFAARYEKGPNSATPGCGLRSAPLGFGRACLPTGGFRAKSN